MCGKKATWLQQQKHECVIVSRDSYVTCRITTIECVDKWFYRKEKRASASALLESYFNEQSRFMHGQHPSQMLGNAAKRSP